MSDYGSIEKLRGEHLLDHFDCGKEDLNRFLKRQAWASQQSHSAQTYVLAKDLRVLGYYILAAGSVTLDEATERISKGQARHPIPVILLARLAVDASAHGKGLGAALLKAWNIAHWQPVLQTFIFENLFKRLRGLGSPDPQILAGAVPRLIKHARVLNTALTDREWLCAGRLTVADLAVGAYLVYAEPAAIALGNYPHLLDWWSRLRRRPAWSAAEAGLPKLDA